MQYCISIFIVFFKLTFAQEVFLLYIGCFHYKDLTNFNKSVNAGSGKSATACVVECRKIFNRFAGLHNGNACLCGESYDAMDTDSCDKLCSSGHNETCGGEKFISLYETNGGRLGSPTVVALVDKSETSLKIAWNPPAMDLISITEYIVSADPIYYFNELNPPQKKFFKYSKLTKTALLDSLQSGSKYEIEIRALSKKGKGYPAFIEAWTIVGEPLKPEMPVLQSRSSNSIIVTLQSVLPTGGPITTYQIVVVDETIPVVVYHESLTDHKIALMNRLPYYIAAEFGPKEFKTVFTVGDNKFYGKYQNAPLKKNVDYHILLGITSTINETKVSYSDSDHSQHESSHLDFHPEEDHVDHEEESHTASNWMNDPTLLGLVIVIILFGIILIVSIVTYIFLRIHFRKTVRHSTDHQELAVHAHIPNQDENGYAVGAHYVEDEEPQQDHYRLLREKVMVFPHHNIRIIGELGSGRYGPVKKCVLMNNGKEHSTALVHQIPDDSLNAAKKRQMLKEFDDHINIRSHENIIGLLGLMENINVISMVFEYENTNFKTLLEESRALQHYPVYAEKNRRFSTFQETQLISILIGIAKGMSHLSSLRITHGQLCSRNIVMKDGTIPKISGFGLLPFHNDVYIPDYRRWQAPEMLRSTQLWHFGDIWSFGCLCWEAVTLGGTPYADIRTDDLTNRIIRGLRLVQPQYVSDEFYQMMLLCWQNDPEERPPFSEIESTLLRITEDDVTPHLLFSLYPSFSYESFSPHLEFMD